MVNNTVNGKKIGKAAGKNNKTIILAASVHKDRNKELNATFHSTRDVLEEEYIAIKAYPGGNPNRKRSNSEELTH